MTRDRSGSSFITFYDLVTTDADLSLLAKDFSTGRVTLGGNEGDSNSRDEPFPSAHTESIEKPQTSR